MSYKHGLGLTKIQGGVRFLIRCACGPQTRPRFLKCIIKTEIVKLKFVLSESHYQDNFQTYQHKKQYNRNYKQ